MHIAKKKYHFAIIRTRMFNMLFMYGNSGAVPPKNTERKHFTGYKTLNAHVHPNARQVPRIYLNTISFFPHISKEQAHVMKIRTPGALDYNEGVSSSPVQIQNTTLPSPIQTHRNDNNNNMVKFAAMTQENQKVIAKKEQDDDDHTEISCLQCGSIQPVFVSGQPNDLEVPMVPPKEITIKTRTVVATNDETKIIPRMIEIPGWLQDDSQTQPLSRPPMIERHKSVPKSGGTPKSPSRRRSSHKRHDSCPANVLTTSLENGVCSPARSSLIVNGKVLSDIPHRRETPLLANARPSLMHQLQCSAGAISVGSIVGQSSFHTIPTESSASFSSSDPSFYQHLRVQRTLNNILHESTSKRRGVVRTELKFMWEKISLPLKQMGQKDSVDLRRASGCLT
jgi:hypothetical protein